MVGKRWERGFAYAVRRRLERCGALRAASVTEKEEDTRCARVCTKEMGC